MLILELEQVIIEKSKLDEIDTELKSHEDEIQEFRDCYAIQRANVEDNNANNSISTVGGARENTSVAL